MIPEGGWGLSIGAFEAFYSGWRLESPDGTSLVAVPRGGGKRLKGKTLDELAALIEAEQESDR
jgi:hypothetical protein